MSINDTITQQSQAGYKVFCKYFGLSTVAVFVLLGLMGLFLL